MFSYIERQEPDKSIETTDLTNAEMNLQDSSPIYHGTLVAEVIAGKQHAGSTLGLAADIAKIYAVRTTDKAGLGFTSTNLQAMIDLNEKYGVKLFNASFGTQKFSTKFKEDISQYTSQLVENGALLVFATGNEKALEPSGESRLPVENPAFEKSFLAVTGLNRDGSDLYRDEQKGANACGQAGRWCLATDYVYGPIYSARRNGLVYFSGTSAAAPKVTAVAARVWSKYPWMTADQVRQVLLTTSTYLDDGINENGLYNQKFGWGRLNIEDALKGPKLFSQIFAANFTADVSSPLAIFSNNIAGDAGLIKAGLGTLVMAGDNTYLGATTINAGKLQVTGHVSSNVVVQPNATLSGHGQVGRVENNGIVSTGDGRLSILGDFTQNREGVFAYRLHHFLTVGGKAQLNGTLEVSAQNGDMLTKGMHDVLYAKEVIGTFATHKSTSPFLEVKGVTNSANKVAVEVDFTDARHAGTVTAGLSQPSGELINKLMLKANTQALNGEQTELTYYAATVQQAPSRVAAQMVLNSNAGAIFAETPSVLLRNDTLLNAQLVQRVDQVTKRGVAGVWAVGSYLESRNKVSGWDNIKSDIRVASMGVDTKIWDETVIGGYISNYNEKSTYTVSMGSSEVKLTELGLYGKWMATEAPFYLAVNTKYGFGHSKFKRTVSNGIQSMPSFTQSDVKKYAAYGELGYTLQYNPISLTPYVALSHNQVSLDALKESSNYGVAIGNLKAKENKSHIGLRFDYALSSHMQVSGYSEYAYAYNRRLPNVRLSSNIDNSERVIYKAPSFDKDYFLYGLGFNYLASQSNWNIFGDLVGNAINSSDYQIQLGLKYAF